MITEYEVKKRLGLMLAVDPLQTREDAAQAARDRETFVNALAIGMYDFGAEHIVKALEALAKKRGFKELVLVIQRGESVGRGTKKGDLKDQEVVDRLSVAFGRKFKFGWQNRPENGWVATSYHIKVVARDQTAVWLSSGNWQSSNQPKVDLAATGATDFSFLKEYNREWHTILESALLARLLEAYVRHDLEQGMDDSFSESFLDLPTIAVPEFEVFRGARGPA